MADNTNEFKILLGAELESGAISNLQGSINSQLKTLNINTVPIALQTDKASVQRVQNQIDSIKKQIQALGNIKINFGGGNNTSSVGKTTSALNKALRETYNLYNQIKNIDMKVAKLEISGIDSGNIQKYKNQISSLEATYQSLFNTLTSGGKINLDSVFVDIDKAKTDLAELLKVATNTKTSFAEKIKIRFDNAEFEGNVESVRISLEKLHGQTQEVEQAQKELNAAFSKLESSVTSNNVDNIVASYNDLENALKKVNNLIDQNEKAYKQNLDSAKFDANKATYSSGMDIWLKKNSAAAKQCGEQVRALQKELESCDDVRFENIKREFEEIKSSAVKAGLDTKKTWDKVKEEFERFGINLSVATVFTSVISGLKDMYDNVVKIDTAMTDLIKVTNETDASYQRFLTNASKNAQELGRSMTSFIQQTANWAKMGFDTVGASELAKISSIYANVADVDDATAVSDMVTAMKAFNIEVENAISIVDPLNKLSNEFAVTAAGLGQGLSRSASTMASAGTDMEHTLALLTGISEITQSPEGAGNFLKTAIARIRGMKGALEELGEEVDESVDSISKVQTQILNLTSGTSKPINIFNDNGEFRDYYEIMQDIASIVDELESTERAQLYEILFGKNRMNQGAAMIQAFQSGRITEALEAATKAAGSAMAEQEKLMNSIEAKLGSLSAALESLSNTVVSSDLVKGAVDFLTGIVNLLDFIIDKFGTVIALLGANSIGKTIKSYVDGTAEFDGIGKAITSSFKNAGKTIKDVASATGGFFKSVSSGTGVIKSFSTALSGLAASSKIILAITAAIGAIAGIKKIADVAITTVEELEEAMNESFDEYEDAKQKVADINSELETTKARIEELENKGGLTFVEEAELDKLREAVELLEIEAALADKNAIIKAKEAAASAKESYDKKYGRYDAITDENVNKLVKDNEFEGFVGGNENELVAYAANYVVALKRKEKAYEQVKDFIDKDYNSLTEDQQHLIDFWKKEKEHADILNDDLFAYLNELEGYKNKLLAVPESIRTDGQKDTLTRIENDAEYLWKLLDPAKWNQIQLNTILSDKDFAKDKKELLAMASANKSVGITVEDVTSKYGDLANAVKAAGLEVQDLVNNVNSEAGVVIGSVDAIKGKYRIVEQAFSKSLPNIKEKEEFVDFWNLLDDDKRNILYEIAISPYAKIDPNTDFSTWSLDERKSVLNPEIDFSQWKLSDWEKALDREIPDKDKISFNKLINQDSFNEEIDGHTEKIKYLQEVLDDIDSGKLDDSGYRELIKRFPILENYLKDTATLKSGIQDVINEENGSLQKLFFDNDLIMESVDDRQKLENYKNYIFNSLGFITEIEVPEDKKLSFAELLIDDKKSDKDFIDVINDYKEKAEFLRDVIKDGITDDEKGELLLKFPDIDLSEGVEKGVEKLRSELKTELEDVFVEVEKDLINPEDAAYKEFKEIQLNRFNEEVESDDPFFKNTADAIDKVISASTLITKAEEEIAIEGKNSLETIQSLVSLMGGNAYDYVNGEVIKIEELKNHFVTNINAMQSSVENFEGATDSLKTMMVNSINKGFDVAEYQFDTFTEAANKAGELMNLAAKAKVDGKTSDVLTSLMSSGVKTPDAYFDENGKFKEDNFKTYTKGILEAKGATDSFLSVWDKSWEDTVTNVEKTSEEVENLSDVINHVESGLNIISSARNKAGAWDIETALLQAGVENYEDYLDESGNLLEDKFDTYLRTTLEKGGATSTLLDAYDAKLESIKTGVEDTTSEFDKLTEVMGEANDYMQLANKAKTYGFTYEVQLSFREAGIEDYKNYFDENGKFKEQDFYDQIIKMFGDDEELIASYKKDWDNTVTGSKESKDEFERALEVMDRATERLELANKAKKYGLTPEVERDFLDLKIGNYKDYFDTNGAFVGYDSFIEGERKIYEENKAVEILSTSFDDLYNSVNKIPPIFEDVDDALGKVGSASDLIIKAEEEIASTGENSAETIEKLFSLMGSDAFKYYDESGIIDTQGVRNYYNAAIEEASAVVGDLGTQLHKTINKAYEPSISDVIDQAKDYAKIYAEATEKGLKSDGLDVKELFDNIGLEPDEYKEFFTEDGKFKGESFRTFADKAYEANDALKELFSTSDDFWSYIANSEKNEISLLDSIDKTREHAKLYFEASKEGLTADVEDLFAKAGIKPEVYKGFFTDGVFNGDVFKEYAKGVYEANEATQELFSTFDDFWNDTIIGLEDESNQKYKPLESLSKAIDQTRKYAELYVKANGKSLGDVIDGKTIEELFVSEGIEGYKTFFTDGVFDGTLFKDFAKKTYDATDGIQELHNEFDDFWNDVVNSNKEQVFKDTEDALSKVESISSAIVKAEEEIALTGTSSLSTLNSFVDLMGSDALNYLGADGKIDVNGIREYFRVAINEIDGLSAEYGNMLHDAINKEFDDSIDLSDTLDQMKEYAELYVKAGVSGLSTEVEPEFDKLKEIFKKYGIEDWRSYFFSIDEDGKSIFNASVFEGFVKGIYDANEATKELHNGFEDYWKFYVSSVKSPEVENAFKVATTKALKIISLAKDAKENGATLSVLNAFEEAGLNYSDYVTEDGAFDNEKLRLYTEEMLKLQGVTDDFIVAFNKEWQDSVVGGIDDSVKGVDNLKDAMGKALDYAELAEKAIKNGFDWSTKQAFTDAGLSYEGYYKKDDAGNLLTNDKGHYILDVEKLKQDATGILTPFQEQAEGLMVSFEEMWKAYAEGAENAGSYEDLLSYVNNIDSVNDYLTSVASGNLDIVETLQYAEELSKLVGKNVEDFYSIENGELIHNTDFLYEWIDSYIDGLLEADKISAENAVLLKQVVKASEQQNDAIEKLRETYNKATSASSLFSKAQEEINKTGANSVDTYMELVNLFGENAGKYVVNLENGGFKIDIEKAKADLYAEIDKLEGATPEIKQQLKLLLNIQFETESFDESVDTYVKKVQSLKDILSKLQEGELSDIELFNLLNEFPELIGQTENLEEAVINLIGALNTDMTSKFNNQLENIESDEAKRDLIEFMKVVLALGEVVGDTQFSINFNAETKGMNALLNAMKESVSSTGLTAESIESLKKRYQELDRYDAAKLFERTTNGIHLNTKALQELESAYRKQQKAKIDKDLDDLVNQYNNLTKQIDSTADATEKANLYAQRSAIQDQINDTAELAAQYEGLTSAYYKWEQAQSGGDERDMYASIYKGREGIEEEMSRGWLDKGTKAYLELLSGGLDAGTATLNDYISEYQRLVSTVYESGYTVFDFFTIDESGKETSEGVFNFFDTVIAKNAELQAATGKTNPFAWVDESGKYHFDFGTDGDKAVAEALGISEELVQIILRASEEAGFVVHLDSAYSSFELLKTEAEKAVESINDSFKIIGKDPVEFNFDSNNLDDINTQIEQAKKLYEDFYNEDGTVNVDCKGYENVSEILTALISKKQLLSAPAIMSVTVNTEQATTEIESAIALLQAYQVNADSIEINAAVGADTSEAMANVQAAIDGINELSPEVKAELGLNTEEFQTACDNITASIKTGAIPDQESLDAIKTTIAGITPEMMVKAGLDSSLIDAYNPSKDAIITYTYNKKEVAGWNFNKIATITYKYKYDNSGSSGSSGSSSGAAGVGGKTPRATTTILTFSQGTAFADGTAGKAYKRGDWGIKDSGVALVGELGQELVVRDGRFFTIGDNSAELFAYKKDDIIFNAEQTKQILNNGKITSGQKRGRAFANGSAFAEGKAFSDGASAGRIDISGSVSTNGSGKGDGSGNSKDEAKETFDWIEVAIDRIERAISRLDLKANSVYKSWSSRNKNLKKEISKVGEEIGLQQQGYERYLKQADSVGLAEEWAKKVRDGKIDIESITDEELAEKIGEYQEWYNKAIDCRDAIDELRETEAELIKQRFDNITTKYEGILSVIEHERSMLEEYISQSEEKGYITSVKYYQALMKVERSNIKKLEKEKAALLESLQNAMSSGAIDEKSEAWYEMTAAIDEVTLAIEQANTAMIEYGNSIRDIEWQIFDLLQDKISQVTQEADFLIDLISNDKLYDDKGQLTDEGMSTMGLHGMNYNVYMAQADKYAQEMLDISKELAEDPYNQTLLDRRQELLELQQESILAAEDEKQAIVDMVREGIELELDSLQKLIDSYTEALDAEKDLYDYQRKIKEQTKEIASLEKQMSVYAGDVSEESKAKIQQIKVSLEEAKDDLEEAQYDRYISDTKKLLSELYDEYELVLNQRLDNIDQLLTDMINEINANSSVINATLISKADEIGYDLSEAMKSTWDTSVGSITTVLTTYGQGIQDGILNASTTLNAALTAISVSIQNMIKDMDKQANTNAESAATSSSTHSTQAQTQAQAPTNSSTSNNSSSSSSSGSNKSSSSSSKKSSSKKSSSKDDDVDVVTGADKSVSSFAATLAASAAAASIFDPKKDSYPKDKLNINSSVVDRLKFNDFDSSFEARKEYYDKIKPSGGTYTGSENQNNSILDYLKKNGYRNGVYKLSKNELAWTQEGGKMEAIIRPSDGAILTPLAKNDSVLRASATANIFDFANDPSEFIRNNLNVAGTISGVPAQSVGGNTYYNEFGIQIELPNVQNYEQFKYAMQHDKSFEKMVRAMTVDKMFGGSSLKKYNC